jgi:cytochrome oxidase Cu insertion factor (SCO1/SenC/PrrC family)
VTRALDLVRLAPAWAAALAAGSVLLSTAARGHDAEPHVGPAAIATPAPSGAPARAEGAPAPRFEPPPPGSYQLPPFGRVAERQLLGPDGAPAPLLGLRPGEAALVSFVYLSCPDACPLATAVLQQVDRALAARPDLRDRTALVTVSFDPERDTPDAMARLARALAPEGSWRFLTAPSAQALAPVLADFGQDAVPRAVDGEPGPRFSHVLKVFLVDGEGRIRNAYSTGFLDARILVNDLATVLGE